MNNSNENTFSNLAKWCEQYHKDKGIKIHPSSVPVELVLEDVLGCIALLNARLSGLSSALDHAVGKFQDMIDKLEKKEPIPEPEADRYVGLEINPKTSQVTAVKPRKGKQ